MCTNIAACVVQMRSTSISFNLHQNMKDYHLALFVCALVMVDVVILFVYTLVEGVRGNLEPTRTIHAENPSDARGVSRVDVICLGLWSNNYHALWDNQGHQKLLISRAAIGNNIRGGAPANFQRLQSKNFYHLKS